jgi:outer membrane protein
MKKTALILAALMPSLSAPAAAAEGDFLVRLRGILVAPNEDSGSIVPAFPGEEVSLDSSFMPEIDISYFVTNNIAFELIAATTKHTASGKSGVTGGIGELASTWVLPPTLTAQYHFAPDAKVRPYVGAGVNYTMFYNDKADSDLEAAVGPTTVKLDDSFGFAVQAGLDISISEKMFLNFDIKYIDMDTTAKLNTTAAGLQKVNIDINPFIFGVGIGTRF